MEHGEKHKEGLWIKVQVIEVRNEKSSKVEKKIREEFNVISKKMTNVRQAKDSRHTYNCSP